MTIIHPLILGEKNQLTLTVLSDKAKVNYQKLKLFFPANFMNAYFWRISLKDKWIFYYGESKVKFSWLIFDLINKYLLCIYSVIEEGQEGHQND